MNTTVLFCPVCDSHSEYELKRISTNVKVKDLNIPVSGYKAYCNIHKDEELFHPKFDQEIQDEAFRIYRLQKGLLPPEDIIKIRKSYGLNQRDFSKLLGFGEITISRYENGSLPTLVQNQIIQSSVNPANMLAFFDQNQDKINESERERLRELLDEMCVGVNNTNELSFFNQIKPVFQHNADIFSGYQEFYLEKFQHVLMYFAHLQKPYKTKLNKLMFYADYNFFKNYQRSITGARYLRHYYGPVPEKYQTLYENAPNIEWIEDEFGEFVRPLIDMDIQRCFNNEELKVLEHVHDKFKNMNSKETADYSHNEKGWIETPHAQFISYEYANKLTQ